MTMTHSPETGDQTVSFPNPDERDDPRIAQALQEYEAALRSGHPPDRPAFLARYPETAGYLDGLDFLHAAAVQLDVPAADTPPTGLGELGDFRLLREVGRGGMGVVYEAEQISLGRRVALKVLPFAATMDPRQRQRFHNEARAAASLHHPHIVPVYAVGVERGVHFYAMQFIDGQSLEGLIHDLRDSGQGRLPPLTPLRNPLTTTEEARTPIPETRDGTVVAATVSTVDEVLERTAASLPLRSAEDLRRVVGWGIQAAEALEHAHSLGIVHRDVKPANLLLDDQGQLWVADFGLARTGLDTGLTMTGDLLGTLRYMSPEQALAKHGLVDHRTDVYSLGATLYELLTLQPVFTGSDRQELLRQITFEDPKSARSLNRAIPADLETIVLKAMEKNPADRYATAQELADDLGRFLKDEPIRAKRPTLWQRAGKWARRHRSMVAATVVSIVGVLLTAVVALAIGNEKTKRERNEKAEALEKGRRSLYFQTLGLVQRDLANNNIGSAEELLHDCPEDLRGWEWHLLKRQPYEEPLVVPIGKVWVMHLACSADGRYLATAGFDFMMRGEVKVRDAVTGKELHTLPGHTGPVTGLAFQPTGGQLATAATDGKVHLWDAATGKLLSTLPGHREPIISLSYRPDGKRLASASFDGTVRVWDLATGEEVVRYGGDGVPVLCVSYSADGRRLASCGMASHIHVWDADTGREQLRLAGHWHRVFSLLFDKDGRHLVSAGSDGRRIWDLQTGKLERTYRGVNSATFMGTFSPDGNRLVFAGCDRTVQVWDWPSGQEVLNLRGHPAVVTAVTFSGDGHRLFSASADGTLRVWNGTPLAQGASLHQNTLQGHKGPIVGLAFSPDGRSLATGALDGTARLWDVAARKLVHTLPGEDVTSVAFHAGGRRLTTVATDGSLVQWDPATGERRRTLRGQLGAIWNATFGVGFSADGERLASLSKDGTGQVWETDSGREVVSTSAGSAVPISAFLSPDGRRVAVADFEHVRILEVESKKLVATLPARFQGAHHIAFSADGQHLAAGCWDSSVRVWDIKSEKLVHTFGHTDRVTCVAFHPSGKQLASGSCDNTAKVWDLETGQEVETLRGHIGYVMCLAYSPDGKLLATCSGHRYQGEVQLWETATFGKKR